MKIKTIINSIFMGSLLAFYPAWGAISSQSATVSGFITNRPSPEIYDVDLVQENTDYKPHILREDTLLYFDEEIPYEIQECAQIYGDMYDICPEFLEAIAFAESSYIPDVENGSCVGLMQINMDCKEQIERMETFNLTESDMKEIEASMIVAADYLHELFEEYEDPAEVLIRYNGDKTGLKRYKKTGEISDYAKKVLELSEQLERKHGK